MGSEIELQSNNITIRDQTSATAVGDKTQSKVIFINKTRTQVAKEAENRSDNFRIAMVVAGVFGTIAACLGATPVGWACAGVAFLASAIAIGILVHRHLSAVDDGFKPRTLEEIGVGLMYGVGGAVITGVALFILACMCLAAKGGGGGGCGGGGGGCGLLRCTPVRVCRPIVFHHHISGVSNKTFHSDENQDDFAKPKDAQYLYMEDAVVVS